MTEQTPLQRCLERIEQLAKLPDCVRDRTPTQETSLIAKSFVSRLLAYDAAWCTKTVTGPTPIGGYGIELYAGDNCVYVVVDPNGMLTIESQARGFYTDHGFACTVNVAITEIKKLVKDWSA